MRGEMPMEEVTPISLAGVCAAQDLHLANLRDVLRRVREAADHLCGSEPRQAEGKECPPPSGVVDAMTRAATDADALLAAVAYEVGRLDSALGISTSQPMVTGASQGQVLGAGLVRSAREECAEDAPYPGRNYRGLAPR